MRGLRGGGGCEGLVRVVRGCVWGVCEGCKGGV